MKLQQLIQKCDRGVFRVNRMYLRSRGEQGYWLYRFLRPILKIRYATFRKRLFSGLDALVHRRSKILIHRLGRPFKEEFSMFISGRMLPHFSFPDYKYSVKSVRDATNCRSKKVEIRGTSVDDLLGHLLPNALALSKVQIIM